jgi:HEAT repeat protein
MRITMLMLLVLCPALVEAQADKQSVKLEVSRYVETVYGAAATFLNRKLPDAQRIKAIAPHAVIYDARQVEAFKSTVLDGQESPEVRAAALRRLSEHISADPRLVKQVTQWLGDPGSPRPLREAALDVEQGLSFMYMASPDVYQKMLDDPEPAIRMFAFTKLVAHGDARAQQRLIRGLENSGDAPLPAVHAISILTMAPKPEFYPAVYKLMRETKDPAIRLEAIRVLGPYQEARKSLAAIAQDGGEKAEFREAALGALYSGDPDNIVSYVMPIVRDESAPPRLQAIGIRMTTDVRQSNKFRANAKRADEYDRLVQKVAREARDSEVRVVASRYIEAVKPRY